MTQNKHSLRITCRKVRAKIANKKEQSSLIVEKLLLLPQIRSAQNILVYYPLQGEVDITAFNFELLKQKKQVFLPFFEKIKVGVFTAELNHVDKYKGYEPTHESASDEMEVVIIPALAYDTKGHRLGHGAGWYDKFLSRHDKVYKIGISFRELIFERLPINGNDVSVDMVVTPEGVIYSNWQ